MVALALAHKCEACSRTFPTQRGLKIHVARWCDGGVTQRSRRGSLADRAVQTAKRREAEALLNQVYVGNTALENVYSFEYLGARLQCDGADDADVRHRMAIAQTTLGSLSNIWRDHRLSRALKLRTYQLAVCSTLTHSSEAWSLTGPVMRSVNGFNSRCLLARNHWPGLPSDGHSPGVRPVACDSPAPTPLPGPHPAHAREQGGATRPASPHGGRSRLPRGQPVYGLPGHRHGPTCRTGTAARCLEHHGQAATTTITLPLYH